MQLPVNLTLHSSRRLAILLLAAHGGALAVLIVISLPVWIRLILLLLICWSGGSTLQRTNGRNRIAGLLLRADGKMEYTRLNGEFGEALPHPHSTVTPQLTILLFRLCKRLESLVLLADSLNEEDFRRLRLWLRWQSGVKVGVGR